MLASTVRDEVMNRRALSRGERKRPTFGWEGLTPTEVEVVGHVTAGRTNPQVAEAFGMDHVPPESLLGAH